MSQVASISSNRTALRIATEASLGVLAGSPIFETFEPNSYSDFGGEITTTPRKPIKSDRMDRKGPVTDLDAKAGFNADLTQNSLTQLLPGFFYAAFRRKVEKTSGIASVTASSKTYTVDADGDDFLAGDLVLASNFTNTGNNGLKSVASSTGTTVVVNETCTDEGSPPSTAKLITVGFQFDSGDLVITQGASQFPVLSTSTKDLTELGLVPGEAIWIGGDSTATKFATAACNGYARVRSIAANAIVLDKTEGTIVTDSGTGKTIQIFLGRVIKNETGTDIVRTTYQLERTLGAPDDSLPAVEQTEYVVGGICSELAINFASADKVTVDLSFMGLDHEPLSAGSQKSATRPALTAEDAFNTSSNVKRFKFSQTSSTVSNVTALYSHISNFTLSLNNNITINKAIATLGGFDASEGNFMVDFEGEPYFGNVSAIQAVRNNDDLTFDVLVALNNAGISIDVPLLAGGGALANVEADAPIKLQLSSSGANGIDVHSSLNHVMLLTQFDYLPTAAM